ncbi:MAG: hypothetical protein PHR90_07385, partial [Sphaerochaetaceae bacterium]|nr:hypothetical protein [Sphaerochaetaceae bacterium]
SIVDIFSRLGPCCSWGDEEGQEESCGNEAMQAHYRTSLRYRTLEITVCQIPAASAAEGWLCAHII